MCTNFEIDNLDDNDNIDLSQFVIMQDISDGDDEDYYIINSIENENGE